MNFQKLNSIKLVFTLVVLFLSADLMAQSNFYDVNSGAGYGLRFWNGSNAYKITMGNNTNYSYGPVSSFSIKTEMSGDPARGFTWGVSGQQPSAALSSNGNFQTKGWVRAVNGLGLGTDDVALSDFGGVLNVRSNKSDASFITFKDKENDTYGFFGFDSDGDRFGAYQGGNMVIEAITNDYTSLGVGGTAVLTALLDGSVQIGSTPVPTGSDYKLAVEGGIITEEVKIDVVTDWADYVFADDYDLKSLEEVKSFVDANSHLPNIPSASEMETNGLNVAKMDALLLEKIEEAFLHLIDMNEQIQSLSDENKALKASLKELR